MRRQSRQKQAEQAEAEQTRRAPAEAGRSRAEAGRSRAEAGRRAVRRQKQAEAGRSRQSRGAGRAGRIRQQQVCWLQGLCKNDPSKPYRNATDAGCSGLVDPPVLEFLRDYRRRQ